MRLNSLHSLPVQLSRIRWVGFNIQDFLSHWWVWGFDLTRLNVLADPVSAVRLDRDINS